MVLLSSSTTRAVPAWMAPVPWGEAMEISLISVALSRVMGRDNSSCPSAGAIVTAVSPVNRSAAEPPVKVTALSSTVGETMAVVDRMRGSASRSIILLT